MADIPIEKTAVAERYVVDAVEWLNGRIGWHQIDIEPDQITKIVRLVLSAPLVENDLTVKAAVAEAEIRDLKQEIESLKAVFEREIRDLTEAAKVKSSD